MYITAHRVAAPLGDEGINAFLHLHGAGFVWPEDPGPLATHNPGVLSERSTEVAPGGNRVLAYLDVLAPDGTLQNDVNLAVADLAADLDGKANPTWYEHGLITLRFGVDPEIERKGTEARVARLRELASATDRLLARR